MQPSNYISRKLDKKIYLLFVLMSAFCFPHDARAKAEETQTIQVQADRLHFNNKYKSNTYQGHVRFTQGSRTFTADDAISYYNQKGEIVKIIATGHPAVYKAFIFHKHPQLIASGNTIYYYPLIDYLEAVGAAQIIQEQNLFQGPQINYDFKKKTVTSPFSNKGHTQITLAPLNTLDS